MIFIVDEYWSIPEIRFDQRKCEEKGMLDLKINRVSIIYTEAYPCWHGYKVLYKTRY